MNTLDDYRREIDGIDEALVALFERRMDAAAGVAAVKRENRLPVYQPERERAVLDKACARLRDPSRGDAVRRLFALLMSLSRDAQNALTGAASEPAPSTLFYGLFGEKLSHSLSEPIHRLFFERAGVKGAYKAIAFAPERLSQAVEAARIMGFSGFNVTIPYKQAILPFLDRLSPEAQAVGAVNTVAFTEAGSVGYNTDAYGLTALLTHMGAALRGETALILGASGGAGRAARFAALEAGASRLYLASRTPEGRDTRDPREEWVGYADLESLSGKLIVNCTPVGMKPRPDASPAPKSVVARFDAVADLVYNPRETRLLAYARECGKLRENGLYMLVAQAVRAQEIWQGRAYGGEMTQRVWAALKAEIESGATKL